MDRGIPEYNRLVTKKWNEYTKRLHKQGIVHTRPQVDTSLPESLKYPIIKTKKEMINEGKVHSLRD